MRIEPTIDANGSRGYMATINYQRVVLLGYGSTREEALEYICELMLQRATQVEFSDIGLRAIK